MRELIPATDIERRIFVIRGHKVMVDRDLAELYEVPTKALNQTVKRNQERFPEGFAFRLTMAETKELVTICDRFATIKHASAAPFAFTEYGVAMLSSVLRSRRAVQINIQIIQTFMRLRQWALTHKDLAQKVAQLESRVKGHDKDFQTILAALRETADPPDQPRKPIGFQP